MWSSGLNGGLGDGVRGWDNSRPGPGCIVDGPAFSGFTRPYGWPRPTFQGVRGKGNADIRADLAARQQASPRASACSLLALQRQQQASISSMPKYINVPSFSACTCRWEFGVCSYVT